MLIYYPTPQLAGEHLRRIDAAHHGSGAQAGIATIDKAGQFFAQRPGPIIAIASGQVSGSDAKSLLGLVNYEANVNWNENNYFYNNNSIGTLLVTIILFFF